MGQRGEDNIAPNAITTMVLVLCLTAGLLVGCPEEAVPPSVTADVDVQPEDQGQPPEDVVVPPEDVVVPPEDVVVPPDDVVSPPEDVLVPPEDVVSPPEDVLVPPEDVVSPPEDVVSPPEDVVVPPKDVDVPPKDEGEPPADTGEKPCTDLDCDDGDACTTDGCTEAAGCTHQALLCDDGDACTADSCDTTTGCTTSAVACDDGDECTTDSCVKSTGCVTAVVSCDDGNECTADSCLKASGCTNAAVLCDDGNACTEDSCDKATGCAVDPVVCDDGNECTTDGCHPEDGCFTTPVGCPEGDACSTVGCDPDSGCSSTPVECGDGDACTADSCDPVTGCANAPMGCDDKDACTEDSCDKATGCGTVPTVCDDGDVCTTDGCDKSSGCTTTPVVCDDGNACTGAVCVKDMGCTFAPLNCDDEDACTDDSCDQNSGCTTAPVDCNDNESCTTDTCDKATGCAYGPTVCPDDGNVCTVEACSNGQCTITPLVCSDGDDCTEAQCKADIGCVFVPTICNDGDACTKDFCAPEGGCKASPISCDDNDPCTTNGCLPASGCTTAPVECNDSDVCTSDACAPGVGCVFTPLGCDDGNECTADGCHPQTGCLPEPISCDDGDACTTDDCDTAVGCTTSPVVCDDGDACTTDGCDEDAGCTKTALVCADGNLCTSDACEPATGCVFAALTCNDNNACTTDTCDGATGCQLAPVVCNDNDECTTDGCEPATGCTATPIACDDQNACTVDACDAQTGCTTSPVLCTDDDACTQHGCDVSEGCFTTPLSCDDNNACTTDSCDTAGGCQTTPVVCDDGEECSVDACAPSIGCYVLGTSCNDNNPCTKDQCEVGVGCTFEPVPGPCDDQDVCTSGDTCGDGICAGAPTLDCDDESLCTIDWCDAQAGCKHKATVCTDDDACTEHDCAPATGCTTSPTDCDDQNACTTDTCASEQGCQHAAIACDDNNACTENACLPQSGCSYPSITCNDNDACTDDACETETGCTTSPTDCNDGSLCTVNGCSAQSGCTALAVVCDDSDACTTDSCDPQSGCQYADVECDDANACTADTCSPDDGCDYAVVACDDGNACTLDECAPLEGCTTATVTCPDDGNVCTTAACDTALGCQQLANSAECDDGIACTTQDECADGECTSDSGSCDDGNQCTKDTCVDGAGGGCSYTFTTKSCKDGDPCTTADTCSGGVCIPGPAADCDDGNPCTDDVCTEGVGCVSTPVAGAPCDGGDIDSCTRGICGLAPDGSSLCLEPGSATGLDIHVPGSEGDGYVATNSEDTTGAATVLGGTWTTRNGEGALSLGGGAFALVSGSKSCTDLGWEVTGPNGICGASLDCAAPQTYLQAVTYCAENGGRLCTASEIQAGATKKTGCGFDNERIWTSTPCDADAVLTRAGANGGLGNDPEECTPLNADDVVTRCCADPTPARVFSTGAQDAFSLEAWVRQDSTSGTQVLLSWSSLVDGSNKGIKLAMVGGKPRLGGGGCKAITGTALAKDTWHHIVGSYDGSIGSLYANGQLVGTGAPGDGGACDPPTGWPLLIGGTWADGPVLGSTLVGDIDDAGFYHRGLSADEVAAHYAAGKPQGRTELCDGLDNDCDGTVDTQLVISCGDSNPCTVDTCDGAAGCGYGPKCTNSNKWCNPNNGVCKSKRGAGADCTTNDQCKTDVCGADGKCTCGDAAGCAAGQFCETDGTCQLAKGTGESCVADDGCQSGTCLVHGFCACVAGDPACSSTQFCATTGDEAGFCLPKRSPGTNCSADDQCITDDCNGSGQCRCSATDTCAPTHFCNGSNNCTVKKDFGQNCGSASVCKSKACLSGQCGCAQKSECTAPAFCAVGGACVAPQVAGAPCTGDSQCSSGTCWPTSFELDFENLSVKFNGVCTCGSSSDCADPASYCSVDLFGPSGCAPKEAEGSSCLGGAECLSGVCTTFLQCGCSATSCAADEYCEGFIYGSSTSNKCQPKRQQGACTADKHCVTGSCFEVTQGAGKVCACSDNPGFCEDLQFCSAATLECEDMVQETTCTCTGKFGLGNAFTCQSFNCGGPLKQNECTKNCTTTWIIPPNDTCVQVDGDELTVGCFGENTLDEPVAMTSSSSSTWESVDGGYETNDAVTINPTGSASPMILDPADTSSLFMAFPSGAMAGFIDSIPFELPALSGAGFSLTGSTSSIAAGYGSGPWITSEFFLNWEPFFFCDWDPVIDELCGFFEPVYTPPIRSDLSYLALSYGNTGKEVSITTPRGSATQQAPNPQTAVVLLEPNDPMFMVHLSGSYLSDPNSESKANLQSASFALSNNGLLLRDSNTPLPLRVASCNAPCTGEQCADAGCVDNAALKTVAVNGHIHAAGAISIEPYGIPMTLMGEYTLDLDPNNDGLLRKTQMDNLFTGVDVGSFYNTTALDRDWTMLFNGVATIDFEIVPNYTMNFPVGNASIYVDSRHVPNTDPSEASVTHQGGIHFHGQSYSPSVPESLQDVFDPPSNASAVMGYIIDTERFWIRVEGMTLGTAGLTNSTVAVTYTADGVFFEGTASTPLSTFAITGSADPATGDFGFCSTGYVSLDKDALNLPVDVSAIVCYDRSNGVGKFSFEFDVDLDLDASISPTLLCGWTDYKADEVLCSGGCSITAPQNCLEEIPGVGDELQSLVDAACSMAGAVINAVSGTLVKLCESNGSPANPNVISAGLEIQGTSALSATLNSQGSIPSGKISLSGDFDVELSFTVAGKTVTLDVATATLAKDGRLSLTFGDIGVTICVSIFKGTIESCN